MAINVSIDRELREKAQPIFNTFGLDISTALNLYLKQVIDKADILFEMPKSQTQSEKIPFSELKGKWKGKIWVSDDFDAPLEEMREYME